MLAKETIQGIQTQIRMLTWLVYKFKEKPILFSGEGGADDVTEFLTMCLEDGMVLEDLTSDYLAELLAMSVLFHVGSLEALAHVGKTSVEGVLQMYGRQIAKEEVITENNNENGGQ